MNPMDLLTIIGAIFALIVILTSTYFMVLIHRMNQKYGALPIPTNPTD